MRIETVGVAKARLATLPLLMLGVLAGAFIGLGAMFFALVKSDPSLGYAAGAVLGGLVFSLGLLLVVVAGAELFTGNNLLAMAWARLSTSATKRRRCRSTTRSSRSIRSPKYLFTAPSPISPAPLPAHSEHPKPNLIQSFWCSHASVMRDL